jgi:hypothetical protein
MTLQTRKGTYLCVTFASVKASLVMIVCCAQ